MHISDCDDAIPGHEGNVQSREHALDLFEFIHQVSLRMQAARGIGDENIDVPRTRCVQGVKDHSGGLGSGLLSSSRTVFG